MIAAIGGLIVEFILLLVEAVGAVCAAALRAAMAPLRYVVSSKFRRAFHQRHSARHWSYRLFAMLWGGAVLALSLPAIAFFAWFIHMSWFAAPPPKDHATAETRLGSWALGQIVTFRDRMKRTMDDRGDVNQR